MIEFLLCLFLGTFGAHKFYNKEWKLGFLYVFTAGLFGFGWIYDTIKLGMGLTEKGEMPTKMYYILGAIIVPYIMFFVTLFKRPFSKKKANATFLILCAIWSLIIVQGVFKDEVVEQNRSSQLSTSKDSLASTVESIKGSSSETNSEPINKTSIKGIKDDLLLNNIISACEEIGLDINEIKSIKTVNQWSGGDVLSFTYQSNEIEVYVNNDKTINSINVAETPVYKQGLSSLDISDYLLSTDMIDVVHKQAKKTINSILNYPDTSKFSWLEWGYGRSKNIYMVSGSVTAQNALGVKDKMMFYIEYDIDGNIITTKYFVLDGKTYVGQKSAVEDTIREEASIESDLKDGSFELIDGVLGDYGKKIIENGYEYIAYNVPAGTYNVSTDMNFCILYVKKANGIKNSDGYIEHEVVSENRFQNGVKNIEVTIKENEWITITVNAKVIVTPKI